MKVELSQTDLKGIAEALAPVLIEFWHKYVGQVASVPEVMTMRQFMDYAQIKSQQTVFNYMDGRGCETPMPSHNFGEKLRFYKSEVDAWSLAEAEARKSKKKDAEK